MVIAGAGPQAVLHATTPRAARPQIAIVPGGGRSVHVADDLLLVGTRSLGERVHVHDMADGGCLATLRGVASGVVAPPLIVATGREGTVVLAR